MACLRYSRCEYKYRLTTAAVCLLFVLLSLARNKTTGVEKETDSEVALQESSEEFVSTSGQDVHSTENMEDQLAAAQQKSHVSQQKNDDDSRSCLPKHHVSFVKIHKTGSGSMFNVLARMVLNYNLTMAIPVHFLIKPLRKFILNQPPLLNYRAYDMFFDHGRYSRDIQLEYMPRDTVFFTQIRHPFTQAASGFVYFGGRKKYGLQDSPDPLSAFINSNHSEPDGSGSCTSKICNFQAFTLGYVNALQNNINEFKSYLTKLDSELFFVSLLEMKAESNLLLKRKMCWHIQDILYIHTHKTKKAAEKTMETTRAEQKHKEMSKLDYILYDAFKRKLAKEISKEPGDFYEELEEYKVLIKQFSELCDKMCMDFKGVSPNNITLIRQMLQQGIDIPESKFNSAFKMKYLDCFILVSKEVINKKMVTVQQYPDACASTAVAEKHRLTSDDCDFVNHVHPGYHIKYFQSKFLNTDSCLGNYIH